LSGPGPIALVGSGEYLPHMAEIEGALFEAARSAGRPARYVQLATAAVPDGPEVVARWHELGRRQADRLGVDAVIVPVENQGSANDPELAAMMEGAGVVYLSGGNPHFLAKVLRGSAVWAAIEEEWRAGAALAGCSAGAMVMAARIPSLSRGPSFTRGSGSVGLGLLAHLRVVPHYDRFRRRWPGDGLAHLAGEPETVHVIGVDEDTAIVGGPHSWEVHGRGSAWTAGPDGPVRHPGGSSFHTA
jgi:cyanophycinase